MEINKERYSAKKTSITNERQLIIQDFVTAINRERKPPYKTVSAPRIATMLSFMTVSQLKIFFSELKNSKSFSKTFWYRMKASKDYKLVNQKDILINLRELYAKKDLIKLKKAYYKHMFYIDKKDRENIEFAINLMEKQKEELAKKGIAYCQKIFGGEIIYNE